MTEAFFSGYCAALNGARTVMADSEDGADCDFPCCAFAAGCPIADQLKDFIEQSGKENASA